MSNYSKDVMNTSLPQPIVSCRGVTFSYQRNRTNPVLTGLDFVMEPGSLWCLLGASGGGKTTLVRLLMGLEVPGQGTVQILGEKAPYPTVRQRVGYMPQDTALYFDLTGRENIEFFGALAGIGRHELRRRVDELLGFLDLASAKNRLVSAYSGGMQRRLSLAIALIAQPDLLILDEPTVGLDPRQRIRIWDHLRTLNQTGTAILVTTHVMDEAERCDQVAMLAEGRILASGTPQTILAQTATETLEDAMLTLLGTQPESSMA